MSSSQKSLSRGEKSLAVVCVLVLLPIVGMVAFYRSRDAEPHWNIPAAPVVVHPNGYDFYLAAAKATVRFTPEVDPASDASFVPNPAYALKNYSLTRRLKWVGANAGTFALFNQGLATPSGTPDYTSGQMAGFVRLRQLARDNSAFTRTLKMQQQPMRATMSSLDGMQMGQDIGRGGGLLPRLVGIAIMAISRSPLDDWNKTINALSASEARTAAQRLETLLAKEPTTEQTLKADKRSNMLELRQPFATPNWRQSFKSQNGLSSGSQKDGFYGEWQRQTISKQKIYDNVDRALDLVTANAKLPYSKAKIATLPLLDPFTDVFVGTKVRVMMNDARNSTSNNMLLLRLALRAYIAQHGQAPPTLAALVPGILKSIPSDVYNDGKPLFYTPQGAKYKLWSVGPDGINNGGVPLVPHGGMKSAAPISNLLDNKGDFVAGLCR